MEEVDWETRYWDLVAVVALEKAEESRKRKEAEVDDPLFKNTIAPEHLDLPVIMTLATPEERQRIIAKMKALVVNDTWTGWWKGKGAHRKPALLERTARVDEQQKRGLRTAGPRKPGKDGKKAGNKQARASFAVTHLVLLDRGEYPTEECNNASHICHKGTCIVPGHFYWSSPSDNIRREKKCRKVGNCNCGLQPPCDFTLHKNE